MKRFLPLLLILLAGCSAAERSRNGPGRLMSNYTVTLYSGGHPVRTWNTKGQVESEHATDGYYFVDAMTGRIVEVAGDIVIEQKP